MIKLIERGLFLLLFCSNVFAGLVDVVQDSWCYELVHQPVLSGGETFQSERDLFIDIEQDIANVSELRNQVRLEEGLYRDRYVQLGFNSVWSYIGFEAMKVYDTLSNLEDGIISSVSQSENYVKEESGIYACLLDSFKESEAFAGDYPSIVGGNLDEITQYIEDRDERGFTSSLEKKRYRNAVRFGFLKAVRNSLNVSRGLDIDVKYYVDRLPYTNEIFDGEWRHARFHFKKVYLRKVARYLGYYIYYTNGFLSEADIQGWRLVDPN